MKIIERFNGRGHANISATHPTTLEVTTEQEISPRADCIVAVNAEKGAVNLLTKLKEALRNSRSRVTLALKVDGKVFTTHGFGNPSLKLSHPTDLVIRKSSFVCSRTLMIKSNKASIDIPRPMVKLLQNSRNKVEISICVEV